MTRLSNDDKSDTLTPTILLYDTFRVFKLRKMLMRGNGSAHKSVNSQSLISKWNKSLLPMNKRGEMRSNSLPAKLICGGNTKETKYV